MKKQYTVLTLFGLLTLVIATLGIYRSYTLESTSLGDCPEGTILGKKGKCLRCDSQDRWLLKSWNKYAPDDSDIFPEDCIKCPNREQVKDRCVLKECPNNMLRRKDGECLKCDSRESWDSWGIPSEECSAKCPNRSMMDGKCVLSSCPPKTFRDEKGNCPYCGEGQSVPPSPEECAKCSNREMVNGKCVFKCNIEGPYFYTSTGICRSCSDSKNYEYSTTEECSKCPNREMFNNRCVLKCNEDEFHNWYGACISCNTDEAWNAHPPEECLKCQNRKIDEENKCVLK